MLKVVVEKWGVLKKIEINVGFCVKRRGFNRILVVVRTNWQLTEMNLIVYMLFRGRLCLND